MYVRKAFDDEVGQWVGGVSKRRISATVQAVLTADAVFECRVSYANGIYNEFYFTTMKEFKKLLRIFSSADEERFILEYNNVKK